MLKSGSAATVAAGSAPAPPSDFYTPYVAPAATAPAAGSLLSALKEELFELEADRLAGKLSEAEYAQHKAAFDVVLRRALNRIEP